MILCTEGAAVGLISLESSFESSFGFSSGFSFAFSSVVEADFFLWKLYFLYHHCFFSIDYLERSWGWYSHYFPPAAAVVVAGAVSFTGTRILLIVFCRTIVVMIPITAFTTAIISPIAVFITIRIPQEPPSLLLVFSPWLPSLLLLLASGLFTLLLLFAPEPLALLLLFVPGLLVLLLLFVSGLLALLPPFGLCSGFAGSWGASGSSVQSSNVSPSPQCQYRIRRTLLHRFGCEYRRI